MDTRNGCELSARSLLRCSGQSPGSRSRRWIFFFAKGWEPCEPPWKGAAGMKPYKMTVGPEGYLPPSVSERGVIGPSKGEGLVMGKRVPEQQAIDETARRLIQAKNPTIFPGPLVLWAWNDRAVRESKVVKALAEAVPAKLIPMADYRPKYPKIVAEREINPNHPNLTIWRNKIDVCLFVGVHCHQSNIALKI